MIIVVSIVFIASLYFVPEHYKKSVAYIVQKIDAYTGRSEQIADLAAGQQDLRQQIIALQKSRDTERLSYQENFQDLHTKLKQLEQSSKSILESESHKTLQQKQEAGLQQEKILVHLSGHLLYATVINGLPYTGALTLYQTLAQQYNVLPPSEVTDPIKRYQQSGVPTINALQNQFISFDICGRITALPSPQEAISPHTVTATKPPPTPDESWRSWSFWQNFLHRTFHSLVEVKPLEPPHHATSTPQDACLSWQGDIRKKIAQQQIQQALEMLVSAQEQPWYHQDMSLWQERAYQSLTVHKNLQKLLSSLPPLTAE